MKPILHNCQTNYNIFFKHCTSPGVVAGNCLIVLTLGFNRFVFYTARLVVLPVGKGTFSSVVCV